MLLFFTLVIYYLQISASIQDNKGTIFFKKRDKMASLMWLVGPGPTAQSWEGVPGLEPSGQQPATGPGADAAPYPPTPTIWCCSRPGRVGAELTEVLLLQVDASPPRVLSERQSRRARAWPPCSKDLLCAGGGDVQELPGHVGV